MAEAAQLATRRDEELEGEVITKKKPQVKKPELYKVIFHNDDYTTMEFVVMVLEVVFHKRGPEATQIMLNVHRSGSGVGGVYPKEVAETKVARTLDMAQEEGHPLRVTMEPE
jgi:ATP-dependent Clp protease adaptor protein ClpS